jgi:thiamine pyrophosphate-dependent acetolactate synthase large subunit-like protein
MLELIISPSWPSSASRPGGHYQQELDLASLFKDVAGDFVYQAAVPEQVRHLVERAVRIALANRTVTALILPSDPQEMKSRRVFMARCTQVPATALRR